MKRLRRVWWALGAVALVVALGAWMLLPAGGASRVSLTLVGWTNSTELVSTNEFAPESARRPKRLALVRIANEEKARFVNGVLASREFSDRGGHLLPQDVQEIPSTDPRLGKILEAGASITVPISVGDDGLPWRIDLFCLREARYTGIRDFMLRYLKPALWKPVRERFPQFEPVHVHLSSETNATMELQLP